MGQVVRGVGLELDAFLEVDQVQLDFLRRIPEGQVGDHHVQQRGFARPGFAGDQRMLGNTFAQPQLLNPNRACPPDRNPQFVGRVAGPRPLRRRGDGVEGHLDAVGITGEVADGVHQPRQR